MVHKCDKRFDDYKEAIEGEGWAINDYKDMISRAKTEKEKGMLIHIMKEEQEHLDELMKMMKCEASQRGI